MNARQSKDLEGENAALRARIEELERKLYPPPPPKQKKDDGVRYFLCPAPESLARKDADPQAVKRWATVQNIFIDSVFGRVRERHKDYRWYRAYREEDIPEGGIYTVARAAQDAIRADRDVPFVEIDQKREAETAIENQRARLEERDEQLVEDRPMSNSLDERRIWLHRWHTVFEARNRVFHARLLVHEHLPTYRDIVQAVTRIADDALKAAAADLRIEDVPGYLPDGWWECKECGYPFPDSEAANAFSCLACHVANPVSRRSHRDWVDDLRTEGDNELAERLERTWRENAERAATTVSAP